jgi:hypothetical protein
LPLRTILSGLINSATHIFCTNPQKSAKRLKLLAGTSVAKTTAISVKNTRKKNVVGKCKLMHQEFPKISGKDSH